MCSRISCTLEKSDFLLIRITPLQEIHEMRKRATARFLFSGIRRSDAGPRYGSISITAGRTHRAESRFRRAGFHHRRTRCATSPSLTDSKHHQGGKTHDRLSRAPHTPRHPHVQVRIDNTNPVDWFASLQAPSTGPVFFGLLCFGNRFENRLDDGPQNRPHGHLHQKITSQG